VLANRFEQVDKPAMAKILVGVAVAVVFVVLCLGLYTLFKGGDTARTWSNKLMRIRVLAQAIAIVVIMAALYFSQR
jgi:heme/copper-type cytochrome/quinol oxidase subunit 2